MPAKNKQVQLTTLEKQNPLEPTLLIESLSSVQHRHDMTITH